MSLADLTHLFLGRERLASPRNRRQAGRFTPGRGPIEALERRLVLATSTWTGAVDALWSTAGNWDVPPAAGNDLVFPAGAVHLSNSNDLPNGRAFGSVTVGAGGYTISGDAVTVAGPVHASLASGVSALTLPITIGASAVFSVDNPGATLAVSGAVSGAGGVAKQGAGNLVLSAPNTYTGPTSAISGTLVVDGTQPDSPVTLASGATLSGTGNVGGINATSATVLPGDSGPGVLTDAGGLTLDAASKLAVVANGAAPASGYSQLAVGGAVNLNGAALQLTVGYSPATGDKLTVLDKTGAGAVNGTFAGLPEGALVTASGHSFSISYVGGTGNDVVLTALAPTTTTVVAAPTSAAFGQTVTLTATVSGGGSPGTPGGTVEFFSGPTSVGTAPLTSGKATLPVTTLPVGADTITAQYRGDSTFGVSTSAGTVVTVAQASTTTTLAAAPNPTVAGHSVVLTATVAAVSPGAGTPTGTVTFRNGAATLGAGTLTNGVATFTTTDLPVGADVLTAAYAGAPGYATSSGTVNTAVAAASTSTSLTASTTKPASGQPVTFTATVAVTSPGVAGPATGSVTFLDGTTALGTATLTNGVATFTTSTLPVGAASVTANYPATTNFTASTSAAVALTVGQSSTSVTLKVSKTDPVAFEAVTLTATVAAVAPGAGTPSGTVEFFSGAKSLGTATLTNGVATLATAGLAPGPDAVTAVYKGSMDFAGATSAAVAVDAGTSIEQLINQVYIDATGVPARLVELDYWRTLVVTGVPVKRVIRDIVGSRGAEDNSVQAGFQTFLDRAGTPDQVAAVEAAPNSGYATAYAGILASTEYFKGPGGGTVDGFVKAAYSDVVGSTIPADTLTTLSAEVTNGTSRYDLALDLLNSDKGRANLADTVFRTTLGRAPTTAQTRHLVNLIAQGAGIRGLSILLLTSKAFLSQYGE